MKNMIHIDLRKNLVVAGWVVGLGAAFVLGFQYGKVKVTGSAALASEERVRGRTLKTGSNMSREMRLSLPGSWSVQEKVPEWVSSDDLSPDQVVSAVEDIVACPDPLRQEVLFSHFLTKITAENAGVYWQVFKEHSSGSQDDLRRLSLVSYSWGVLRGESAVRSVLNENTPENRLLARHAIEGWAAENPESAVAFMKSEHGFKAQSCRFGLLKGLGLSDPRVAIAYLVDLDTYTDARPYLKPVLDSQLKVSFEGAEKWVNDLPSARLKEQGFRVLAQTMAEKTPEEALAWLGSFAEEPFASSAVSVITSRIMGSSDHGEDHREVTLNWIRSLTSGDTKNMAYESSLRSWSKRDPTAAAEHLNTLEPSPERDFAVRGFSLETAKKYPDVAVQWAATISDSTLRQRTLILAGKSWLRKDPEAADQWLEYSDLEEKTLLAIKGGN